MQSNSKLLYAAIGALVVVIAGLGYYIYDQNQQKSGIELKIGDGSISIQPK